MSDARALLSEIARLKAELADANEAVICAYMLGAEKAKDEIARLRGERDMARSVAEGSERDLERDRYWLRSEVDRLKAAVSAAEEATRKAMEAIPLAMDAAVEKEREACAKLCEGDFDSEMKTHYGPQFAAAIRARASEAGNE